MSRYLLLKYDPEIRRYEQLGEAQPDRKSLSALARSHGQGEYHMAYLRATPVVVREPLRPTTLVVDFGDKNRSDEDQ